MDDRLLKVAVLRLHRIGWTYAMIAEELDICVARAWRLVSREAKVLLFEKGWTVKQVSDEMRMGRDTVERIVEKKRRRGVKDDLQ